jgi:hypothetical protein
MNKNNMKFQGDVGIVAIEKVDREVTWKKVESGFIVAYGEISGHHHKLVAEPETLIEIAQDANGYFLRTNGKVTLTHQSHAPQTIEKGTYFVPLQVEYNEVSERRVLD